MVKKIKTVLDSGEWHQGLTGKGNKIFRDDGNNALSHDEGWAMKVYELSKFS